MKSIDKDAERTSTGKLISSLPSVRNLTMTSGDEVSATKSTSTKGSGRKKQQKK